MPVKGEDRQQESQSEGWGREADAWQLGRRVELERQQA